MTTVKHIQKITLNIDNNKVFTWNIDDKVICTIKHMEIDDNSLAGGNDFEIFEIILKELQMLNKEFLQNDLHLTCEHPYSESYDAYCLNHKYFVVEWGDCYDYPFHSNTNFKDLSNFVSEVLGIKFEIFHNKINKNS